jgi:hypothetical protein
MTWKERERAFYVGAPLAIVPALAFLPAIRYLVIAPSFARGPQLALVLLPVLALPSSIGLWKLAISVIQRPFGILNVFSAVALMVMLIIAAYTGLFLAFAATTL